MVTAPGSALDGKWRAPFALIWGGQAVSSLGSALAQFGLIWWLTVTTGSATTLALAALVGRIPLALLTPLTGALVDRWSRRWVLVVADACIALLAAVLAALFYTGRVRIWQIMAVLFLRAVGEAFHSPAIRSATPLLVPRGQLTRVAGMNATLDGLTRIVAAPLGALLLGVVGVYGLLAIDVLTAAAAIAPLLVLPLPQLGRIASGQREPSLPRELAEGLRYLAGQRGLFLIFATATAAMLFLVAPLNLVPLLVRTHFRGGAMDLGYVESAYGWGYLAGGAILSAWGGFRRRMVTSLAGQVGLALGIVAMGLVPAGAFWLAVVAWCAAGLMLPMATGPLQAIYQSVVPPEMQGRILALNTSMLNLATPLGLAIGGPLADRIGVRSLFVVAGAATLAVAAVRAASPAVMALDGEVAQGA